ncbi:hypothetical protein EDD86DRAFT_248237 [Gorgonomyces haynaldii]|nr:hypothetical protein EDD86DRAFT_248237 [Gorgonomyces haynaldii]
MYFFYLSALAIPAPALGPARFADIDISKLTGDGQEAAAAALKVCPVDMNGKDQQQRHDIAEDAELEIFNPAIAKATGAEKDTLQCQKLRNKILKLTCEVGAAKAKGNTAKAEEEAVKLNKNIGLVNECGGKAGAAPAPAKVDTPAKADTGAKANTGATPSVGPAKFADIDISKLTGDGQEAAAAALKVCPVDMNGKDQQQRHDIAEDAELEIFNPAIAKATGTEKNTLQCQKLRNKILKLTCEVGAAKAKGNTAKAEEEAVKLNKNIGLVNECGGKAGAAPAPAKVDTPAKADTGAKANTGATPSVGPAKFADIDISKLTGDGQEAAAAALKVCPVDMNGKDQQQRHDIAEDAELEIFNPAIAKATGAEKDTLQCQKLRNKILKLTCEVGAAKAKGNTAKAEEEAVKLNKNIGLVNECGGN